LKRKFTIWALAGTVLPIVAIQPMRFYVVYYLALAVAASLVFERGKKRLTGLTKQTLVIGGLVVLLVTICFASGARQGLDLFTLENVSGWRHSLAMGAHSGFAEGVDVSTPLRALAFLPWGMTVLLLGPLPWQFTSARSLFAAPEVIFWW